MSPLLPGCIFGYLWPASSVHVGTDGVVRASSTHIQVGPVPRLNQTDEVSTFPLWESMKKIQQDKRFRWKKENKCITKMHWKKSCIIHNALLVNSRPVWLKICHFRFWLGCVWQLCVSVSSRLQFRPHCQKNVSKHQITVRQKPETAEHLSCGVCLWWGLRVKSNWMFCKTWWLKTFWLDRNKTAEWNLFYFFSFSNKRFWNSNQGFYFLMKK